MSGVRLVEELRQAHDAAEYYVYPEWAQMFKAAADRVEHLEAEVERLTPRWTNERPTTVGDYLLEQTNGWLMAWRFTEGDFGPGKAADVFASKGMRFAGPIAAQETTE